MPTDDRADVRQDAGAMVRKYDDAVWDASAVVERIWARDESVWPRDAADPAPQGQADGRFAWLDAADRAVADHPRWVELVDGLVADGVTDVLLIGTGGAVAHARLLASWVSRPRLRLHVLDTVHPDAVHHVRERFVPATWAVVASVVPGDVVTSSLLARFRDDLRHGVGDEPGLLPAHGAPRLVVIDHDTRAATARAVVDSHGWETTVSEPTIMDGPFGSLGAFGLLAAAALGIDGQTLLGGLAAFVETTRSQDMEVNEAARLGAFLATATRAGRNQLTVVPDETTTGVADWIEHLVAAATGKSGTGLIPIVDEPLLEPVAYGPTRCVVTIGTHHGIRVVAEAGIPVATLDGFGLDGVAVEVLRWQFATAVACALIGVDPFALPDVMAGRALTRKVLDGGGQRLRTQPADDLVDELEDADWLAMLAFVDPDDVMAHALRRSTATLRRRYGIPVRLSFAPACLATTGQLHKGGPPGGVFAVVVEPGSARVPVPDANDDFTMLLAASAAGDVAALRAAGRVVAVVDLQQVLDA